MKSALTFLLACILLCCSGAAGDEALEPWYIARGENGLFGYIDRQGQWRIGPQFANGDAVFAGRYQLISTDAGWNEYQGIIDRQGAWALEPEYMIYAMDYLGSVPETGNGLMMVCKDGLMGYFDMDTGFFSGLQWPEIWEYYTESTLLAVTDPKTDAAGYIDRANGEQVIPGQYQFFNPGLFHEGIAVVSYDEGLYEGVGSGSFMINESGAIIPLPEGIEAVYGAWASCGRVAVEDKTGLVGYADLQGRVVIPPQYLYGNDFCENRAAVEVRKGEWAVIDLNGEHVLDHLTSHPRDYNGGLVTAEQDGVLACFDAEGCALPGLAPYTMPAGEGLFWMPVDAGQSDRYWWKWRLADKEGHFLSDAVQLDYPAFDISAGYFSDGLQPVGDGQGHWGYMNCEGMLVIACQFDNANPFHDGLALVTKNGKLMYINPDGTVAWEEKND